MVFLIFWAEEIEVSRCLVQIDLWIWKDSGAVFPWRNIVDRVAAGTVGAEGDTSMSPVAVFEVRVQTLRVLSASARGSQDGVVCREWKCKMTKCWIPIAAGDVPAGTLSCGHRLMLLYSKVSSYGSSHCVGSVSWQVSVCNRY